VLSHKNSLVTIGRYPIITLSEARTEAKRLLAEFTLGKVRSQSATYKQAVELFLEEKTKARRGSTVAVYRGLLNSVTLSGQLSELTHEEVRRRLSRFTSEGAYNHHLVALTVFFNWCAKRRYITDNPTRGLSKHARATRSRVLTDAELQSIWRACRQRIAFDDEACGGFQTTMPEIVKLPRPFAAIVKLLILTGQRRGEIAALRAEFLSPNFSASNSNQCTITLPAALTKNKREHIFPLGCLATSFLSSGSHSPSLFFSARGKPNAPFNGWSKSKAALDELSGVSGWTLHDLRRTFATRLAELAVAPHVIERLLNHVTGTVSGVAAVYNRATYMAEMRTAIELWEHYLQEKAICGEQPGSFISASET